MGIQCYYLEAGSLHFIYLQRQTLGAIYASLLFKPLPQSYTWSQENQVNGHCHDFCAKIKSGNLVSCQGLKFISMNSSRKSLKATQKTRVKTA